MNTLNIKIPYDDLKTYVDVDWNLLFFGFEKGFVEKEAVVQHSYSLIEKEANPSPLLLDLAWEKDEHSIYEYLLKLADPYSTDNDKNHKEKFLFLVLNRVFENRDQYADPLELVEIVYADFDYPEEVSTFVRYMPAQFPLHNSQEENINRLYENWEKFLLEKIDQQSR
ncbi:DUF2247 family protein [Saccharibacillus sp. JS10]|uniref:DUF2247 family protein n=1 Tax=Saccharibacillus sp. JS10 TaxID=2950552 RepID=UPI00210986F4|nr:DUF2247 family protein [Saccharibacillus sp. JS10]MCQ4087534.1 DUF2247 family protein [Saccharibacillus sp. JS10]